jgi:O-antigen ligase
MTSVAYATLWVFVFSIPWENVLVIPGVGAVTRLTGLLAAAIAGLAIVASGRMRRWHAFHLAALLFVIWAGFGLLVVRVGEVPAKFWTYVMLFVVVCLIWELARSAQRLLGLLMAYVCGAGVSAVDTIMATGRDTGGYGRFTATGFDPNDLAMTLALALPMAWYLGMIYRRPLLRWLCRAYLPIGLLAIALTGSRGGMLASVVGLLIVPLSLTNQSPGRLATTIAVLVSAGGLAVAYVPETLFERLGTTGDEISSLSFGNRFELWRAGLHAFIYKPVVGYGPGGFLRAVTPELGIMSRVAHNSLLSVLVEQGIVGLLLYVTMLFAVFREPLKLSGLERRFAFVLIATLVMAMLPLTWEDRKPVWFVLAALLGLSQAWVSRARGVGRRPGAVWGRPGTPQAAGRRPRPLTTMNVDPDATE